MNLNSAGGKRSSIQNSSDDEEVVIKPQAKKRRVIDDESDEEQQVESSAKKSSKPAKRSIAQFESDKESSTPAKSSKSTPKQFKKPQSDEEEDEGIEESGKEALLSVDNVNKVWAHQKIEFLKPDKIRDKNKNRPGQPEYDARTLHVPEEFLRQQTPAMFQWWKLKSDFLDCLFFFKVGKFYELYHMDAIVGVEELGFSFMGRDAHAHSGFPESAYEKMASALVEKGYKVARIEQTENPQMMEDRCKRDGTRDKFSKVMKREVCQITDRGTQIFSNGQQKMTTSSTANFLLSIAEQKTSQSTSRYGICFVDTSIGDFMLGEFDDDQECSRLLTLLSHYAPV